jgi:hypothetical protein
MSKHAHCARILFLFFALLVAAGGGTSAPANAQTTATLTPVSGDRSTVSYRYH